MIATFSSVTRVVARAAISLTSPTHPAISTRSPILIGRSKSRIRPLKKLLVMFCRPKPSPTPTAPTSTFNDVRSIPAP